MVKLYERVLFSLYTYFWLFDNFEKNRSSVYIKNSLIFIYIVYDTVYFILRKPESIRCKVHDYIIIIKKIFIFRFFLSSFSSF